MATRPCRYILWYLWRLLTRGPQKVPSLHQPPPFTQVPGLVPSLLRRYEIDGPSCCAAPFFVRQCYKICSLPTFLQIDERHLTLIALASVRSEHPVPPSSLAPLGFYLVLVELP